MGKENKGHSLENGVSTGCAIRKRKREGQFLDSASPVAGDAPKAVNVSEPNFNVKPCLEHLASAKKRLLRQKEIHVSEKMNNISEISTDVSKAGHFDPRLSINKNKVIRPKRMSFQFVEAAANKGFKGAEIGITRLNTQLREKEPIPQIEWWDVPILRRLDNYTEDIEQNLKMDKLTIYVEHPAPLTGALLTPSQPPPQVLRLTSKERKKLRTQNRLAREKQKQVMIRQGLMEAPRGKVKIRNFMKVLCPEAIQEPTKFDKQIHAAAAESAQAHADRNTARKLTPVERAEKKEKKLFVDANNNMDTTVSVYKINSAVCPQNRFKLDINAQQNRLTGCAVLSKGFSVVVVEGGSKSMKRYTKLMLERINWSSSTNSDHDDEEVTPSKCALVWQGIVAKPSFNKFSVHNYCPTEAAAAARTIFADAGVGHYWDIAERFSDDSV